MSMNSSTSRLKYPTGTLEEGSPLSVWQVDQSYRLERVGDVGSGIQQGNGLSNRHESLLKIQFSDIKNFKMFLKNWQSDVNTFWCE